MKDTKTTKLLKAEEQLNKAFAVINGVIVSDIDNVSASDFYDFTFYRKYAENHVETIIAKRARNMKHNR